MGVSVASGAASQCQAGNNPIACFQYGDSAIASSPAGSPTGWESYNPQGSTTNNKFTSKNDFSGQYLPKDRKNFLGIGLKNSSLILKNLNGAFDQTNSIQVGIYVDNKDNSLQKNALQLGAQNSVLISNIRFTNSGTLPADTSSSGTSPKNIGTLIFDGNKVVEKADLTLLENNFSAYTTGGRKLSQTIESQNTNKNNEYALVGGIFNSSGARVTATFSNGARMFGDIYSASSRQSQTEVIFKGQSNGDGKIVFDGGIQAKNGKNTVTITTGDANIQSASFGEYGIWAEHNGNNILNINGTTAQTITISNLTAKSTNANSTTTSNTINFTNTTTSANKINITGGISTESAKNEITSKNTSTMRVVDLSIGNAIVTRKNANATKYTDTNIKSMITINGNMNVGENTLKTMTGSATLGISTWAGVANITLSSSTTANQKYESNKNSLTTPRIYASAHNGTTGKNIIKTEGDITLSYIKGYGNNGERETIVGGDIIAANGGINEITLNGVFKVQGWKPKTPASGSNGEVNEKETPNGTTIDKNTMSINAYGGGNSKNIITVKNTNGTATNGSGSQDIAIGTISAYGGTNQLSLYGSSSKKVEIASLIASNIHQKDAGGQNEIFIKDGSAVNFNEIVTKAGGSNKIAITKASTTSMTGTLKFVEYSVGGENIIYFGKNGTSGTETVSSKNVKGVKITLANSGNTKELELGYTLNNSKLDLTIGNTNGTKSYFDGKIAYTSDVANPTNSNVNYIVNKNSVFFANLAFNDSTTSTTTSDLTLKDGAKYIVKDQDSIKINTLTLEKSTNADTDFSLATSQMQGIVIDLATNGISDVTKTAEERKGGFTRTLQVKTLTVSNGTGQKDPLFRLYTKGVGQTDNVVITDQISSSTTLNVQVFLDDSLLNHDFGVDTDKTVIFKNTNGTNNLTLNSQKATTGFTTYQVKIEKDGSNHTWYLGDIQDKQINTEAVEYTTSAMGINYGIFVQNINSLNKRMGELRNNDDTQGVWARVFTGKQTSTMDLIPSDSTYVTVQGGYDYGFGVTGGTNYLGVALSYGYTSSETDRSTNAIASITGYSSKSSNIEVAVYNSYIQDEGWFSDTIAKFGYIMSDFDIYEQSSTQKQSLSNFALSLGQEVGYRFALGSEKNWFIDPQVELVAGYINSTDLSQAQGGQILDGKLDSVFLFRTRVGSDFGYSLKKDKNQYDFRLGLSYEYDVANADAFFDIASANMSKVFSNAVDNDGRVVLNVGTNMKFGENMRLYFDFEKSFAGKITTDYQVNLGFRYGFGEKLVKVVEETNTQEKAPLKIENTQTQEQPQNQVQ